MLALNLAGGGCANTDTNSSVLRSNWNEMQSLSIFLVVSCLVCVLVFVVGVFVLF